MLITYLRKFLGNPAYYKMAFHSLQAHVGIRLTFFADEHSFISHLIVFELQSITHFGIVNVKRCTKETVTVELK
jgi:hypothetical protein